MESLVPIIPGLSLVSAENNGRFPYAHSLLVEGTARVLIDTGCGERALDALRRKWHVDYIIASHSHPDHTALNWKFNGTPIYAPAYTADTFGDFERLSVRFVGQELASEWRALIRATTNFQSALPTHTYATEHVFDFGKVKLGAIHTPGHTADHMCLFEPTYGVLLAFDIDLTSFGPWYANPESDPSAFEDSIRRVMALAPRVLVSSHKGVITDDIPARLQRYLDVIAARDRLLLDLLPHVRTLDDLVDLSPFYHGYPYAPRLMRYWETQMIRKHLARLGIVLSERSKQ
jgi:glyoxylase-like metal-dependent hydrolase (beta-lactamase superfamily II)